MEELMQSANINKKWLDNIYENIKRIEESQRLAREGCKDLYEYYNVPERKRQIILGDIQYKNLRFIISEFYLLLDDLTPILDEKKEQSFRKILKELEFHVQNRKSLIKDSFNSSRMLIQSRTTENFWEVMEAVSILKTELFKEIKHILYIDSKPPF
jgi:hypothetical protein